MEMGDLISADVDIKRALTIEPENREVKSLYRTLIQTEAESNKRDYGSIYMATPVDLVFILLPIFDEAIMKNGDNLGKFRQLDEILFVEGYRLSNSRGWIHEILSA